MKTNITKKVKQIIEDEFLIDYDGINDKTNFRNDLGLDSLDKVVLILECERKFNISINDLSSMSSPRYSNIDLNNFFPIASCSLPNLNKNWSIIRTYSFFNFVYDS